MRNTGRIGRTLAGLVVAGGFLAGGVGVVSADQTDPRWLPWLGCWEAEGEVADQLLCIRPLESDAGVEMVTVREGRIVASEIVRADGEQTPARREGCNGWERAAFSADNQRVYLRSEFACEGDVRRSATGLISMLSPTEWLDIQAVGVAGQDAVRVLRYRLAPEAVVEAAGVEPIAPERAMAVNAARRAASAAPTVDDVIEASREISERAVEAWVVETGERFALDADELVRMADAGVGESVIDLIVAVSYPSTFDVDRAMLAGDFRPEDRAEARTADRYAYPGYVDLFYWDPLRYSRYGYYSPYGFGGGYGWYPGYRPVVVVVRPDGDGSPPGRVVRGRGYTRGSRAVGSSDDGRYTPPRTGSTGSSVGTSTTGTRSGAASGSGTTTRRAKARSGSGGGN